VADAYSDPEDASGYAAGDILSLGFKKSKAHAALLEHTKSVEGVKVADYDALFVSGGQSPMVTFRGDASLQKLVVDFYEAGRIVALVCHATCLLLETKLPEGRLLVEGKTWTGFANSEERYVDSLVGKRIQPFWIEDEARKIPGTNFVVDQPFREFAVRDGRLVTGQQQNSGSAAARLVVEALGR
jgi:putative intracellular protease/amidase